MLIAKRIFLRSFRPEDAAILLKWGQDEHYRRLAGFAHYQNLAEAQQAVQQYIARPFSRAICLKQKKQMIGLVELYDRGFDEKIDLTMTKEVGFLLDRAFEGQGYMIEALRLLLDYAFQTLHQKEIWAGTFDYNFRSQRLLKNLGFTYVYDVDYRKINHLFSYKEKYYLLKSEDWLKIMANTKS